MRGKVSDIKIDSEEKITISFPNIYKQGSATYYSSMYFHFDKEESKKLTKIRKGKSLKIYGFYEGGNNGDLHGCRLR